jgi:primosomal protein N'
LSRETSLVSVALPLPIHSTFTYSIEGVPPEPGSRVQFPFRQRDWMGWVVGRGSERPVRGL